MMERLMRLDMRISQARDSLHTYDMVLQPLDISAKLAALTQRSTSATPAFDRCGSR
jgi:hypothetical protein